MTKPEHPIAWVVYLMTIHKKESGMKAVCEQSEWEEMELARPGYHTLVQDGIGSEAEAEKLARIGSPSEVVTGKGSKVKLPLR